jgi:hypothetical protein
MRDGTLTAAALPPASIAGEAAATAYFTGADALWRQAAATKAGVQRHYTIAGLTVCLHFAGPQLLPLLTPALGHLETPAPPHPPALTVRIWDAASTGVPMPAAPIPASDFTRRGELEGLGRVRHRAAYDAQSRTLSLYDKTARVAWFCAYAQPIQEQDAPLRWILGWLMQDHRQPCVHAASVGTELGGVLLIGRGGSGKSNTSVGCMLAGLHFAGDDYCSVAADPRPIAFSLYSSAKLRAGDWARPPLQRANPAAPATEKEVYFLHPHFAGRIKRSIAISAIVVPQVGTTPKPQFERIAPRIALIELTSQSVSMLPHAGAEAIETIAAFVRELPCYRFHLGRQPAAIPQAVSRFIDAHVRA